MRYLILILLFTFASFAEASYYIPPGSITADKLAVGVAIPAGVQAPFAGPVAPAGWLMEYGQTASRVTYANLYNAICPQLGTVTITIASPGVVTLANHNLHVGDRIRFATTGTLPSGITDNSDFYVATVLSANTFTVSTSQGGVAVNTTGGQSGTQSAQFFGNGAGDGSTTFGIPDARDKAIAGAGAMGGTDAGLLTPGLGGIYAQAVGSVGGDERMQAHNHTVSTFTVNNAFALGGSSAATAPTVLTTSTAGAGNSQNVQPTLIQNMIIKY